MVEAQFVSHTSNESIARRLHHFLAKRQTVGLTPADQAHSISIEKKCRFLMDQCAESIGPLILPSLDREFVSNRKQCVVAAREQE